MLEQILPLLQKDASRGFIRNWFDLRDGRIAPDRRDIDPVRMAGALVANHDAQIRELAERVRELVKQSVEHTQA